MGILDTIRSALGLKRGSQDTSESIGADESIPVEQPKEIHGWDGPMTQEPALAAAVVELMGCVVHEAFSLEAYEAQGFQSSLQKICAAGATADAVEILRRAVMRLPPNRSLEARLARLYSDRYDNDSARRLWESLSSDHEYAAEAHFELGELAERQMRMPEAAAHYQRTLAYDFAYPNALGRAQRLRGQLPSNRMVSAPTVGGASGVVGVGLDAPVGYELAHPLGRGGYGTVYLATDTALHRQVAIKFLHPHLTRDERKVQGFFEEARLVARLQAPGVVRIYDLAVEQRVIVMEYMTRGTLRDRLTSGRPLGAVAALDVAAALLDTLAQLHEAGIVHRDIKPSNILFRSDGSPVLGDFGVATLESGPSDARVAGTLLYMAPEQRAGTTPPDRRSDIYAIGLVLAEMIAGGLPAGTTSRVHAPEVFVSLMPEHVAETGRPIFDRLLCRDPQGRPAKAEHAAQQVRSLRRLFAAHRLVPDLLSEVERFSQSTGAALPGLPRSDDSS